MPNNKQAKCSVCGQPIKTSTGAVAMKQAPLVCRRCFGQESYKGQTRWTQHSLSSDAAPSES